MSTTTTNRPAVDMNKPATTLRIYNTLSRDKEAFVPLAEGRVGIYLCGPTVYKPSHIGHMVGPVIFDAVKRYLVYSGYDVTLVINVTDVDDKLIAESQQQGITMPELADKMTADYMANLAALGVDTVDHFPRATDNMEEIIQFTSELVERGFAYEADGDVYFDVGRDTDYGKLSHRSLESLQGEGGEMAGRKRAAADFALWKSAKPGEPSWESPWGPGRPGWHIECSAMSRRLLGRSFDIHGGGLDLIFPHHENEIAQSECCHGQAQAKYWMHNGLMQAADEVGKVGGRQTRSAETAAEAAPGDLEAQSAAKISKSRGSSAFSDLLKRFAPETVRLFLLSTHYRRPIYFSDEQLSNIETSLQAFYRFFERFQRITGTSFYDVEMPTTRAAGDQRMAQFTETAAADGSSQLTAIREARQRFLEAMDDDFNSGAAVGDLFELVRALNKLADAANLDSGNGESAVVAEFEFGASVLRELAATLGLFRQPVETAQADDSLVGPLLDLLVEVRNEARANKNFALADKIRDALGRLDITIEDRASGTIWRRN